MCYILFGDFMKLYYKNETLFVKVNSVLDEEYVNRLKRRVFHIVDDYEIDHVVFELIHGVKENIFLLQSLEREYRERFGGDILFR